MLKVMDSHLYGMKLEGSPCEEFLDNIVEE